MQPIQLTGDWQVQVTTAAQEVLDEEQAGIRFWPDGRSTGGRITLSRNDQMQHIDIAWLTGRIRVHASAP
jgi:general secretion pathway protein H